MIKISHHSVLKAQSVSDLDLKHKHMNRSIGERHAESGRDNKIGHEHVY